MNVAAARREKPLRTWLSNRVFRFVHGNNLVYNACWEDPRIDRQALQLSSDDTLLVITSAGCNALDYLIAGCGTVHAVDMNPRQNALLELKLAAARQLAYEDFFAFFGDGFHPDGRRLYERQLAGLLTSASRRYWDRWIEFFTDPRCSFYFRGTSGAFARGIAAYIDRVLKMRREIQDLLAATTIDRQRELYAAIEERLWSPTLKFMLDRDATLSLLGVPKPQRRQIDRQYPGGVVAFIRDCMRAVFAELPLVDNYFWRVYITGRYTPDCCPTYLTPSGYDFIRNIDPERLQLHTSSVCQYLNTTQTTFTRFVLLDHMDWLADHHRPAIQSEWQAIADRAASRCRILWRSGGLRTDFLNDVRIRYGGREATLPEHLTFDVELAARLHAQDRVHTYGSFYIADL